MTSEDRFALKLYKLADVVYRKHFPYIRDPVTKDELIQSAVVKAYALATDGRFDPSRSSWRNYLYTGMRNEMSNFLYKSSKEIPVDELYGEESADDPELELYIPTRGDFYKDLSVFRNFQSYIPAVMLYFKLELKLTSIEVSDVVEPPEDLKVFESMVVYAIWKTLFGRNEENRYMKGVEGRNLLSI